MLHLQPTDWRSPGFAGRAGQRCEDVGEFEQLATLGIGASCLGVLAGLPTQDAPFSIPTLRLQVRIHAHPC